MEVTEIRWHGRGGQGAKTAATIVAELALVEGKYSQGFPDYGPERMGAPMRGFTRISDSPINVHCAIEHPDIIIVLDDSLLKTVDVCAGTRDNVIIIVNTCKSRDEIKALLSNKVSVLYTLDATGISLDEIKRPIPNTPLIGALIKAAAVIKPETAFNGLEKKFKKKFGDAIVKGNINAVKRAIEEVVSE